MTDIPTTEIPQADVDLLLRAEAAAPGNWYALFPIVMFDPEKRALEVIAQAGSYEVGNRDSALDEGGCGEAGLDPFALDRLQREFQAGGGRCAARRSTPSPTPEGGGWRAAIRLGAKWAYFLLGRAATGRRRKTRLRVEPV